MIRLFLTCLRSKELLSCLVLFFTLTAFAQNQDGNYMLKTTWTQGLPYNQECPVIDGKRTLAGCGPIAIAQILNYYKYPNCGYGWKDGEDFSSINIDWENIKDEYVAGKIDDSSQGKAVARLVSFLGKAMNSTYGINSTSTRDPFIVWGLQNYLHISPKCLYIHRRNYTSEEWKRILDNEITNGRPVMYVGTHYYNNNKEITSHIFIIDGKNDEGLYHVNFGIGSGKWDKFVNIDVINQNDSPCPGGYGVCYNNDQAMLIQMVPLNEDADYWQHPIRLGRPFVINSDKSIKSLTVSTGQSFQLAFDLQNCGITGAEWELALGVFKGGKLKETVIPYSNNKTISINLVGVSPARGSNRTFRLPKTLENGEYDLRLMVKSAEDESWRLVWEDALNNIHASINNTTTTLTYNGQHSYQSVLTLRDDVKNIENQTSSVTGKTFLLSLRNSTDQNFEDTLKLVVQQDGSTVIYKLKASIYSHTDLDYKVLIPSAFYSFTDSPYHVSAYYFDSSTGTYVPLECAVNNLYNTSVQDNVIKIYSLKGVLLYQTKNDTMLPKLPAGIYIIQQNGKTRKYISGAYKS